jgi:hypothetical protein
MGTTSVNGRREICEARSKVDAVLGESEPEAARGDEPCIDLVDDGPPTAEVPIVRPAPVYDRSVMQQMRNARVRASVPPSPDGDVTTRIKVLDARQVEADATSSPRPSSHASVDVTSLGNAAPGDTSLGDTSLGDTEPGERTLHDRL